MSGDEALRDDVGEISRVVTVGELGMLLPIGTGPLDGGGPRDRTFAIKDWTAVDERALSAWRRKNPSAKAPTIVLSTLAHFVTQWGSHDFTKLPHERKMNVLAESPSADIFHAWVILRIENLSEEYKVSLSCQSCRSEIPFTMSLEDIELTVPVDEAAKLTRDSEGRLRRGIEFKGARRMNPIISPVRWKTYVEMYKTNRNGIADIKLALIRGAVVGFDDVDGPVVLHQGAIDSINKRDIESLSNFIEEKQFGPDLSIVLECPHCGTMLSRSVIWEHDVFFSGATSSI